MRKKAIIFDLDGTIVTTEEAWVKAGLDVLAQHGITKEKLEQSEDLFGSDYHGVTPRRWIIALRMHFELPVSAEELYAAVQKAVYQRYETEVAFVKGFEEFISQLQQIEMKRAIATNSDDASLDKISAVMNLSQFFGTHMYNISHVTNPKPNPDLYLHAAESLGEDPKDCIAIEDSAVGIAAAKAAGMYCIGLNTANQPEQLKQADIVADHYQQLSLDDMLG